MQKKKKETSAYPAMATLAEGRCSWVAHCLERQLLVSQVLTLFHEVSMSKSIYKINKDAANLFRTGGSKIDSRASKG